MRISIYSNVDLWINWKPLARIGVIVIIVSVVFGVTSISGLIASYESITLREQEWNNIFNERLLQLDILLNSFVDICKAGSGIKENCDLEFTKIWDSTCNRETDWDVIDSCKRIQGFLIANWQSLFLSLT